MAREPETYDTNSREIIARSSNAETEPPQENGHRKPRFIVKLQKNLSEIKYSVDITVKVDALYGLYSLFLYFLKKVHSDKPAFWEKKHKMIKAVLLRDFETILKQHENDSIYDEAVSDHTTPEYNIWVYWDNPERIPPIVERCIRSIKENAEGKKVVLVTEGNYDKYIDLPYYIKKKYAEGLISKTHFSDIIRVSLLTQYGGIYMDATVFQIRPFDTSFMQSSDFYTFKLSIAEDYKVVSHGKWCVFFIVCKKNNLLMNLSRDMMLQYWKKYDLLIDYLLIDYLWSIAIDRIPSVKKMMDDVPYSNPDLFRFRLKDTFDEKDWNSIVDKDGTDFLKFSFKSSINAPIKRKDGRWTVFGKLLNT